MINDATKFRHPVDWKLRLLDILVSFFGDGDASKITVLELAAAGQVFWKSKNKNQQLKITKGAQYLFLRAQGAVS